MLPDENDHDLGQATTPWRPPDKEAAASPSATPPQPISAIEVGDTHTNAPTGTHPPRGPASDSVRLRGLQPDPSLPQIPGYEMLALVASGGMGVVYRARDLALDRIVALKVPKQGFLSSSDDKERFVREARSAARLRHANICPIYEVKEVAGQPYLSMAFIDGDTLRDWALGQKPGPRQIAELMATLATAVQFAHDQKVVHRDLKPSNVMVERHNGQPLLMDFGLAKDLRQEEGLTASGDILGTPAYMAPEQAAGRVHEIGPLSDVYALGAILYELLSGSPPFKGSIGELLVKVQSEEPRSLRKLNPAVHTDLETICQKAMAKVPSERYVSATELGADLQRFARGDAILARRQPWLRKAWRHAAKNRLAAVLGTCLVLLVVSMAWIAPNLTRSYQVTRLTTELQQQLRSDDWHPRDIPAAQALLDRLSQVSPADANLARPALTSRLNEYLKARISQKLTEEDATELETYIQTLESFDSKIAEERRISLESRLGKWQRIATLKTPFTDVQQHLPGLRVKADASALLGPTTAQGTLREQSVSLSPAIESGNFHLEGKFFLPTGARAGLLISASERHETPVTALAVSPDGKFFASADGGGVGIRLFQTVDGTEVGEFTGHSGPISALAFSPDGAWLASAGWDGEVHVFRTEIRKLEKTLAIEVPVNRLRGFPIFLGPPLAFDHTGTQLLAGSGDGEQSGEVRRWKLPEFSPLPALRPKSPTSFITHLSSARTKDRIAAGTFDRRVVGFELQTGATWCDASIPTHNNAGSLAGLAIHPSGNLVAATVDGLILLLDEQGQSKASLQGYGAGVYSLAFDPDGRTLAAGYESGEVMLWDPQLRTLKLKIPNFQRRCLSLAFGPEGRWLVGGMELGTIYLWEVGTGQERYAVDGQGYRFIAERTGERELSVRIERGSVLLREQTVDVGAEPFAMSARRAGERLELQINSNKWPPLVFHDFFPPRPISNGRWGVMLSPGTEMAELIVRRSIDIAPANPLEQGDTLLQAGEYAEAWELFEQQLADGGNQLPPRLRQEAALKSALCLRRLSRDSEALERLRSISGGEANDPAVVMARFQLWELLIRQQKLKEADATFENIRLTYAPSAVAEVIPATQREQMVIEYASPLMHKNGLIRPGTLARLKTAMAMADFNQLKTAETFHWQARMLTGLRLNEEFEQATQLADQLLTKLEDMLLRRDLHTGSAIVVWNEVTLYGYLARLRGEPRRLEPLLDSLASREDPDQRWPELASIKLTMLLEKARIEANAEQWPAVIETLQPLLREKQNPKISRLALGYASLLHGFALRKLNREEEALAAWSQHPYPPLTEGGRLDSLLATEMIQVWMLRSLANDLSDSDGQALVTAVKVRATGSNPGFDQVISQVPITSESLRHSWRSQRGLKLAEQAARGDLLPSEEIIAGLEMGALQQFRQGAFDQDWPPAQEELVADFAHEAFLAFSREELSPVTIALLAAAWKDVPYFLGWKRLIQQLPPPLQGRTAYMLGMRRAKRGSPSDARELWLVAQELAPQDEPLQSLVKAALEK